MGAADLLESAIHQHQEVEPNEEMHMQGTVSSDGNYTEEVTGSKSNNHEILEKGSMQYGCRHYRRRCQVRAPRCNEIFYCRHCHNEAKLQFRCNSSCGRVPNSQICTACYFHLF